MSHATKSSHVAPLFIPALPEEYWYARFEKDPNEATGSQSFSAPIQTDGVIYPLEPMIPTESYRKMMRNPTIAMSRCLMIAPMTLAQWSVNADEDVPEELVELVNDEILARKEKLIKTALEGVIDFGWIAYEVIYNPAGKDRKGRDAVTITDFKHLLQEFTFLRANPYNGRFVGIMQDNPLNGQRVYLPAEKVQLFNIDQRGSNWYGNAMLDNCIVPFRDWCTTNEIAMGYMRKIAGVHWALYYSPGITLYKGRDWDNSELAPELLHELDANGSIAIPCEVQQFLSSQGEGVPKWKIEKISDSGAASAEYIELMRYRDGQMVSGLMFPPNALLEGHYGTKAEAVVHAEAPIAAMEMRVRHLVEQLNEQTVNRLLELNAGSSMRGKVRIEVAPITHDNSEFIRNVYQALLSSPDANYTIASRIDQEVLTELSGIPKLQPQDRAKQFRENRYFVKEEN
ncbi:MAG: hypothetical protein Q4D38_12185 [Planctomycetia bacterium]|nr:hypothetical protein [Planctomycetia bacterium]